MTPEEIHEFGWTLRGWMANRSGAVAVRFSPGNGTVYEMTFTPLNVVATEMVTPGEYPAIRSIQSATGGDAVLISKTNGSNTWGWWMGLNNGYLDPGYVKQNTGMGWGDVSPVGLMLNGYRNVPWEQIANAPYVTEDGRLDLSLGGLNG